jgi:predicted DNA-binding protein with PD1-like motif
MRSWLLLLSLTLGLWGPAETENLSMKIHAFRLRPGQDLKQEIQAYVREHQIRAGWLISCVGSLQNLRLRLANRQELSPFDGYYEIVSATGTLGLLGVHLHLSASDSEGRTLGGHLVDGNRVYTTVEIVLGESPDLEFERSMDSQTGYPELHIKPRP